MNFFTTKFLKYLNMLMHIMNLQEEVLGRPIF